MPKNRAHDEADIAECVTCRYFKEYDEDEEPEQEEDEEDQSRAVRSELEDAEQGDVLGAAGPPPHNSSRAVTPLATSGYLWVQSSPVRVSGRAPHACGGTNI